MNSIVWWMAAESKKMGTGKNLNLFWENFYRKIDLLIRDKVYMNDLNMVFLCGQILAIFREEEKGCDSYKRFLFTIFREKKRKNSHI